MSLPGANPDAAPALPMKGGVPLAARFSAWVRRLLGERPRNAPAPHRRDWHPNRAMPAACGKFSARSTHFGARRFEEGIALLLLVHLLTVAAMAASPSFHEWLHHDSDHEDHECAVTLFLSAGIQSTVQPVLQFERIALFDRELAALEIAAPGLPLLRSGILEHAPPPRIAA
jgi:hypothetical protein